MRPLDGVTIVDFSRVLAGPMATQILADLGASVVKIEKPGTGDESRTFEPRVGDESAYFFAFNRGKSSVVIDLSTEQGRQDALDLVSRCDVVVENFLPGTMRRLGLGYDTLRAVNEDLIYVAATGFGQDGPEAHRRGYDTVFQALSGIMSLTGHPDGPPAKTGVPIADMTSGLWIAISVLTGLVGRMRHGTGTFIDLAMMDVQTSLLALAAARVFALDENPTRTGTEHPGRVPSAAFESRDGWVHISGSDQHWSALCEVLELDDLLADADLRTNAGRLRRRDEVMVRLRQGVSQHTQRSLVDALHARGVPAGEVRTVQEALQSPQTVSRGMVGEFLHPKVGPFPALRTPIHLSSYDDPEFRPPPELGADNATWLTSSGTPDPALDDSGASL